MKTNLKYVILSGIMLGTLAVSCVPESIDGDGNGLVPDASIDAGFTITETSANHYVLKANANNYIVSKWNIDGGGFSNGKQTEELFLPDAGKYVVKHAAIGQGGNVAGITEQTITVAKSDPKSGNLIKGGKFDSAEDIANWKILKISNENAAWTLGNGAATLVASLSNQQAIYQAVDVVAGTKYTMDMQVSSPGLKDTWFEVLVLDNEPPQGNDVSGTVYRTINTWAGCGNSEFNGKISAVGCDGDKNKGVYTATKTGKVFFLIKCGGASANVKVDNVELRGLN